MNRIQSFIGYRMLASRSARNFWQILRDRRLAISLILPPTLQLLLFGFASECHREQFCLRGSWTTATLRKRRTDLLGKMTESQKFLRLLQLISTRTKWAGKLRTVIWMRAS